MSLPLVRELPAPGGWTALVLEQRLPLEPPQDVTNYRAARVALVRPVTEAATGRDVFFLFDRCRPEVEVPLLREHARQWMPDFGLGVWVDSPPPITWTREYLLDTPTEDLRPPIERCVLIKRDDRGQALAERLMLGSGALIHIWLNARDEALPSMTEILFDTIDDISLKSFPFYFPLLRGKTLLTPDPAYQMPLHDLLPNVAAYARESTEDGGFFLLVHTAPARFFAQFPAHSSLPFTLERIPTGEAL